MLVVDRPRRIDLTFLRQHLRIERVERRGETLEIPHVAVRRDVDVARWLRPTLRHGCKGADQDELDAVTFQLGEDRLGIEGCVSASHWRPPPAESPGRRARVELRARAAP